MDFKHQQTAHCESGVTANLLSHYGVQINEPMAFGIGAGLFFVYLPFLKVDHIPLTAFRTVPGGIFRRVTRQLGVQVDVSRFRSPDSAMQALDDLLDQEIPVGLQVGVFWLPYFPKAMRFHFNAHNLIVFGRDGDDYLISDPCFSQPVRCSARALRKARFARGALAPHGKMYILKHVPADISLPQAVYRGIRRTQMDMRIPLIPYCGINGIRYLAGRMRAWPQKMSHEKALLHIAQIIRMLEEIGTGGAGFRYLFAAFLQESAGMLPNADWLAELAVDMEKIGDRWREFSLMAARICKGRAGDELDFDALSDILYDCAEKEEKVFLQCKQNVKKSKP